jgi:hypothetical protein
VGFREKETVYALTFEGDFEGLVVKVTDATTGQQQEIERAAARLAPLMTKRPQDITPEEVADGVGTSAGMVDAFLEHLVEWNVEDPVSGEPIPATREGLARVSSRLGKHIITTWWDFVSGEIPAPLGAGSSSGEPSLVASLPMEPLSPSHTSSSEPSSSSASASGSGVSRAS